MLNVYIKKLIMLTHEIKAIGESWRPLSSGRIPASQHTDLSSTYLLYSYSKDVLASKSFICAFIHLLSDKHRFMSFQNSVVAYRFSS